VLLKRTKSSSGGLEVLNSHGKANEPLRAVFNVSSRRGSYICVRIVWLHYVHAVWLSELGESAARAPLNTKSDS
jgi:hypothetical protein